MLHSWTLNITCVIKVQARDAHGFTSDWSEGLRVNVTDNHRPNPPSITGDSQGRIKKEYTYQISSIDPDEQNVSLFIDWGDGTNTNWLSFIPSGSVLNLTHSWATKGTYTVKAKAKDTMNKESEWATFTVTMPFTYNIPLLSFLERFFERFPHAFPLLRHLIGSYQ
jgi:hypothetical protein